MRKLTLNLKAEYFAAIKAGDKPWEYRIVKPYWERRLAREYDVIEICSGYPPKDDTERRILRKWKGYEVRTITHKHFGDEPVTVFAIDVGEAVVKESLTTEPFEQAYEHLIANPDDWEYRLIYADWLDEQGDEVAANGQRWQVVSEKYPEEIEDAGVTTFDFWSEVQSEGENETTVLAQMVIDAMEHGTNRWSGRPMSFREHYTMQEAELALAKSLHELGIVAGAVT